MFVIFCISNFQKNGRTCGFQLNIQKQKMFQLSPDPRYRLALCALAMPPLPNSKYATGLMYRAAMEVHLADTLFLVFVRLKTCFYGKIRARCVRFFWLSLCVDYQLSHNLLGSSV